jgi:hypothetical protein
MVKKELQQILGHCNKSILQPAGKLWRVCHLHKINLFILSMI